MDIVNRVRAFFLSIFSQMFQLSPKSDPRQPTPPPSLPVDLPTPLPHTPSPPSTPAASQDVETAQAEHNPQPANPVVARHQHLDWTKMILAFCFASAVDIAILSVQTHSKLPSTFHFLSLAISFAFASLFVAKFIPAKYYAKAQVLEGMAVFFAATAFFLAVAISIPTSFKCTTWTVYAVSLLAVILCNRI